MAFRERGEGLAYLIPTSQALAIAWQRRLKEPGKHGRRGRFGWDEAHGQAKAVGATEWVPAKYLEALPSTPEGFVAPLIVINGSKWGSRHPPRPGLTAAEGRVVPALQDLPCKSPATTCAVLVTSSQK